MFHSLPLTLIHWQRKTSSVKRDESCRESQTSTSAARKFIVVNWHVTRVLLSKCKNFFYWHQDIPWTPLAQQQDPPPLISVATRIWHRGEKCPCPGEELKVSMAVMFIGCDSRLISLVNQMRMGATWTCWFYRHL